MTRSFVIAVSLFAGILLVLSGTATAEDAPAPPPPCKGPMKLSQVKSACKKGGQPQAKKMMKAWVKRMKKKRKAAKVEGFKLTCKTCHTSLKGDFPLKADAHEQFKTINSWKPPAAAPAAPKNMDTGGFVNYFSTLFL